MNRKTKPEESNRSQDKPNLNNSDKSAETFFNDGLSLLKQNKTREAMFAFKQAVNVRPNVPRYISYYGLSWAMDSKKSDEALRFCQKALENDLLRPELYCNLGKVYILRGDRKSAIKTLQQGLSVDNQNKEILNFLKEIGIRKTPIIPFLSRDNPINKYLGKAFKKLGLRT
jgi:tetratricopeptide (TPR) repeat protein